MDHSSATVSPQGWCNLCELLIIFSVDSRFQLDAHCLPAGIAVVTSFLLWRSCLSEGSAGMSILPECWLPHCWMCRSFDSASVLTAGMLILSECWLCHIVHCAWVLTVPEWWMCWNDECARMMNMPEWWMCHPIEHASPFNVSHHTCDHARLLWPCQNHEFAVPWMCHMWHTVQPHISSAQHTFG